MGAPGTTVGPYRAVIRANQTGIRSVAIDMPSGSRSYEKSGPYGRTHYDEQDRFNAHQFAAAPEMYDALGNLIVVFESLVPNPSGHACYREAVKAIRKAQGLS